MKENPVQYDISKFKYSTSGRVKFYEVDLFGVTHNIRYMYWMEDARINYMNHIGIELNSQTFTSVFPVMVIHSEIDYFAPTGYNDSYEVLTRVSFIKNSSLGFENIVQTPTGTILAFDRCVLVYLDKDTKQPTRIPDIIRKMISDFGKSDVEIIEKSN